MGRIGVFSPARPSHNSWDPPPSPRCRFCRRVFGDWFGTGAGSGWGLVSPFVRMRVETDRHAVFMMSGASTFG